MHMTQDKLAEQAGISLSFLGHIERGTRKASMETIVRLANELHISIDYLMADSLRIEENNEQHQPVNPKQRLALNEILRVIQDYDDAWKDD